MEKGKILTLEDRIPKIKQQRRQKANRRLIFYVSIFFLLIIGILYLQSPLSHIAHVKVEGNIHVSAEEIVTLSELTDETSFWNLKNEKIINNIKKNVEIKDVKVERVFPNEVLLTVTEMKRVAYSVNNGEITSILENGQVLKPNDKMELPSDAPILINWEAGEELAEMASELTMLTPSIANSISEIHHTPTDSNPLHITLFMNDGREVSATITDFANKMSAYPSIVSQLDENLRGVIHMEVGYYFESYEQEEKEQEEEEVKENESER